MNDHRHKVYFYPHTKRNFAHVKNPYAGELRHAISQQANILNKNPSNKGFLDFLKYITRVNIVFFNWIEDLPDKKGGIFQSLVLILFLHLHQLMGIRIIWTLHNKLSHYHKNLRLKRVIFYTLLKKCDVIMTHSCDGISYAKEQTKNKSFKPNIYYFPHPAYPLMEKKTSDNTTPKYDILIWGTITEYKGIDGFLEYLQKCGKENNYKILIAGKIQSEKYKRIIMRFQNENIHIINEFVDDKALVKFITESKLVLFTYNNNSILSSGALIFSFVHGAEIIGPDTGSFKDLNKEGFIEVFKNYEELILKIDNKLSNNKKTNATAKIKSYLLKYNWNNYIEKIIKTLEKN